MISYFYLDYDFKITIFTTLYSELVGMVRISSAISSVVEMAVQARGGVKHPLAGRTLVRCQA